MSCWIAVRQFQPCIFYIQYLQIQPENDFKFYSYQTYPLSFSGSPCDVSDNRGWFPLHEAAAAGQTGCLRSLLEHKSEDVINSKAYSGETALFLATVNGHVECVKMLMDFGADVNIMNDEEVSLLVAAVKGGSLECFQVCITHYQGRTVQVKSDHLYLYQFVHSQKKMVLSNGLIMWIGHR